METWARSKDGVVDHDAVHPWLDVGLLELVLQVGFRYLSELKLQPIWRESLLCPFGVLFRGRVAIGEEAHQFGSRSILEVGDHLSDLSPVTFGNFICKDLAGTFSHGRCDSLLVIPLRLWHPSRSCHWCLLGKGPCETDGSMPRNAG